MGGDLHSLLFDLGDRAHDCPARYWCRAAAVGTPAHRRLVGIAVDDAHIWAVGENGTIVSFGHGPGTGNSILENQEFPSMHVFPNPATDRVTLSTETGSIKEVVFINLQGQAILRKEFGSGTDATINVSGLKHGLYLLRIKTQQDIIISKVVIE